MAVQDSTGHDDSVSLIDHYLRHLDQRGLAASTGECRGEVLRRADRELPMGLEIANTEELKAWLYGPRNRPARPRSRSSIATYYGTLKSFYAWAFDARDPWLVGDNPWTWMPDPPKVPPGVARPIEDERLARILAEAIEPFRRWALIAAYQGLRCCEISGLDREHVTEARLLVARGKGGKPRWHDTDPYVWEAVRDLPPGPIAIDWRTGERASARFVSIKSAQYFTLKLGMPDVALHRMRHWLGVTVQARYRDARTTQEVLGHTSLASTQIYTRATVEQQRAARGLLPRLAG